MTWEAVIGLEVHVQLRTETKMFCRCPNRFGAPPNSLVCAVCLGYPGSLPVANRRAVELAASLALALGCQVQARSVFARKNYFYPDLPKGYQISQYDRPLALGGEVPLAQHDKRARIHRLHLEEDAGKLLHEAPGGGALQGKTLVDFNRCGAPLVEIVSEPDLRSAAEAQDYLQTLHQVLLYTGASDASMEQGSLRCDANVSLRRSGEPLGTKAEVKNLNSFRHLARAIEYEIDRQAEVLEGGGEVAQETRSFDAERGVTRSLRSKEEAHDYRYFPEPDLPPLAIATARLAELRAALPELPWERRARLRRDHGLAAEEAQELTASRELADYFEAAVAEHPANPRAVGNWVRSAVLAELKERKSELAAAIAPRRLAALVRLVDDGEASHGAAREVLTAIWESEEEPRAALARLALGQVSDEAELRRWVDEVIAASAAQVAQYRAGKTQLVSYFVGQVMKRSGGRAAPRRVEALVRGALDG